MELFNSFPDEILLKIFSLITVKSRLNALLVCKRWHDIIEPTIRANIKFVIRCAHCDPNHDSINDNKLITDTFVNAITTLSKSNRKFSNLLLDCVHFNHIKHDYLKMFAMFGSNLNHLCLSNCVVTDYELLSIVSKCCPNLTQLSLNNNKYFVQNKRIYGDKLKSEFGESLKNLEILDLSGGQSFRLCDALFMSIASQCTQLRVLRVCNCKIVFHSAVIRRYYFRADDHTNRATEYAFTFTIIMQFLETYGSSVEHIDFSDTSVCKENLIELLSSEPLTQLRKLTINNCANLDDYAINEIKNFRPNIEIMH